MTKAEREMLSLAIAGAALAPSLLGALVAHGLMANEDAVEIIDHAIDALALYPIGGVGDQVVLQAMAVLEETKLIFAAPASEASN